MTDTFNVTATPSWDPATPVDPGTVLTVTIAGDDVHTVTETQQLTVTLTIAVADDLVTTETLTVPLPVAKTTSTHESVVIATVTDDDPTTRAWTVDPGGLSATATA